MDLRQIQSGRGGFVGVTVRLGLRVLSWGWGLAARFKNASYALGVRRSRRLPVVVLSVGNLAVGGTGKTPFVAWLAQRLVAAGRRPGILARGYGGRVAGRALNDEGLELLLRLGPGVPQRQCPDRVRGGHELLAAHPEVDVILLDDGFQHRRLARDLDIVLLDAMEPFGLGALLPRGRLREPLGALRRADVAVLTRVERVGSRAAETAARDIAGRLGREPVRARSRPRAAEDLTGQPVYAVCGIGNPAAFLGTLADLGAQVVGRRILRDHEVIAEDDWKALARAAREVGAARLVTTRKDAVKYERLPGMVVVVDVETEIVSGEEELWAALQAALSKYGPTGATREEGSGAA